MSRRADESPGTPGGMSESPHGGISSLPTTPGTSSDARNSTSMIVPAMISPGTTVMAATRGEADRRPRAATGSRITGRLTTVPSIGRS